MVGMPAAAPYAASAAEVSPVEAQATACTGEPRAIICLTTLTSTVMPRSLNDPVWLLPDCFTHRSGTPISSPSRAAQKRLVLPSKVLTMLSSSKSGMTHSL